MDPMCHEVGAEGGMDFEASSWTMFGLPPKQLPLNWATPTMSLLARCPWVRDMQGVDPSNG